MGQFDFKFSRTKLLIAFLALVAFGSWFFAVKNFQSNRTEIVIQLADIFDDIALPFRISKLATMPRDVSLLMPVANIRIGNVADTWGEARSEGRTHEGVDIFAERGTPVFSATSGYVLRVGVGDLGGNYMYIVGPGGVRYYYAHFDSIAKGISRGDEVTSDTVLGFVGTTGNAVGTPPHLHFGVYGSHGPENPYPLLSDR